MVWGKKLLQVLRGHREARSARSGHCHGLGYVSARWQRSVLQGIPIDPPDCPNNHSQRDVLRGATYRILLDHVYTSRFAASVCKLECGLCCHPVAAIGADRRKMPLREYLSTSSLISHRAAPMQSRLLGIDVSLVFCLDAGDM